MGVATSSYLFFDGVGAINHTNWGQYLSDVIPDSVIGSRGTEFAVTPSPTYVSGVRVSTGKAFIAGVAVRISTNKELQLPNASSSPRYDVIVLRLIYGGYGESTCELDYVQGTAASSPSKPELTKEIGTIYEFELATVYRPASTNQVTQANIDESQKFVFMSAHDNRALETMSTSVTPKHDREYRATSNLSSLTVNLPLNPPPTYETFLVFSTSSSFSGVTLKAGGSTISSSNIINYGDALNLVSKHYNMAIWYDGSKWIICAKAG